MSDDLIILTMYLIAALSALCIAGLIADLIMEHQDRKLLFGNAKAGDVFTPVKMCKFNKIRNMLKKLRFKLRGDV